MRRATGLIAIVLGTVSAACGDNANSSGSRDGPSGDTTVVTSKGDGIWGPAHEVVEVLRVPSDTKETTFGRVQGLDAAADGGVFVFDAKGVGGAIVRQFDANGRFVRNIGREGHGPGEYSGEIVRITESNGVIAIRDMYAINRFTSSGKFIDGFSVGRSAGTLDVAQGAAGSIYTTAPRATNVMRMGRRASTQPVFHYDSNGKLLDSVAGAWLVTPAPVSSGFRAVQPTHETRFALSDGRVVVGRSDKLGFLVITPKGKGAPVIAVYETPAVPYLADEREKLRADQRHPLNADGKRNGNPGGDADVTRFKPPLMTIRPDADDRIWLTTPGPSTKLAKPYCNAYVDNRCVGTSSYSQTSRLLGFRADGTFLGEIRFPLPSGSRTFAGDYAWCVRFDDDEAPYLVKYRLHD